MIKFNGIDLALKSDSFVQFKIDENNFFEAKAIISFSENGQNKEYTLSKEKTLADCICSVEEAISNKPVSKEICEYAKSLKGMEWLLEKDFEILLGKETQDKNGCYIIVTAKDQYLSLVNGLFCTATHIENGARSLFAECNGWASTLKSHFERTNEREKK